MPYVITPAEVRSPQQADSSISSSSGTLSIVNHHLLLFPHEVQRDKTVQYQTQNKQVPCVKMTPAEIRNPAHKRQLDCNLDNPTDVAP